MMNIYAHSFMTATRQEQRNCVAMRDTPAKVQKKTRRRWLPNGHWWLDTERCVDLEKL